MECSGKCRRVLNRDLRVNPGVRRPSGALAAATGRSYSFHPELNQHNIAATGCRRLKRADRSAHSREEKFKLWTIKP